MSTVCLTCGALAKPNATKCIYCGGTEFGESTPVRTKPRSQGGIGSQTAKCGFGVFDHDGWRDQWKSHRDSYSKLGLILTNTAELSNPVPFQEALDSYIRFKDAGGINYCVLDLKDQRVADFYNPDCRDLIPMIRDIYAVAIPDYLFIIGDVNTVPGMEWINDGDDEDYTVQSDLPYITLDTDSPWSGKIFDFLTVTAVGRLPTSPYTGFSEAIHYLSFCERRQGVDPINAYTLSTLTWEATSHTVFDFLNPLFQTSPYVTCSTNYLNVPGYERLQPVDPKFNLLGFNLHGGEGVSYWGGESVQDHPIAFHPSYLPVSSPNGYVICVEACYGANPVMEIDDTEPSALVFAMDNRCLAFVGSTRVAWGRVDGGMGNADIIAHVFCKEVNCGKEYGEAFLNSLTALCNSAGHLNGVNIKTLAEFNLYGDPSGVLYESAVHHRDIGRKRNLTVSRPVNDSSRAFKLLSCDEAQSEYGITNFSSDERAKITLMAQRVVQTGKSYMQTKFPHMASVQPKVFKIAGQDAYQSFYTKTDGNFVSRVSLITNGNGEVVETLIAK